MYQGGGSLDLLRETAYLYDTEHCQDEDDPSQDCEDSSDSSWSSYTKPPVVSLRDIRRSNSSETENEAGSTHMYSSVEWCVLCIY